MKKLACLLLSSIPFISTFTYANESNYPNKPIKLVVGYAPGGFTDVAARLVASALQKRLGQPVVVENKAGATGTIGAAIVARAEPDGYTLLLAHVNSNAVAPALFPSLQYDVIKDFTPIVEVATTPMILVTNPGLKANDVKEFINLTKEKPLNFASSGIGSSQHLAASLFMQATGTKMTHVPYKGSSQANNDLLSGVVDVNFDSPPPTLQFIKAGKLKALAITSENRSTLLPNVPTMKEAGLPEVTFTQWFGLVGPAGLSEDVVQKLNKETNTVLKSPEILEKLRSLGADPAGGSSSDFATLIRSDKERLAKLIKEAGISISK